MYKNLEELRKMTVKEVVQYINYLSKNDKGAMCNLPIFQEWCFTLSELDNFSDIARELHWDV